MGNLAKRFATAGVLVPIILVAIFVDPTPFGVLAAAVLFGCIGVDEWMRMGLSITPDSSDRARGLRTVEVVLGALMIALPTLWDPLDATLPLLTLATLVLPAVVLFRKEQLPEAGRHVAVAWSGMLYVALLMSVLPLFKRDGRPDWLVVTLCVAFFSDTVAYFFGRFLGKRKLYPEVSPKKTRAGAVGGLVGGTLATVGVGTLWLIPELPLVHALVLGPLGSVAGQIGDLVASMAKRTFGVKDSGHVLPGHGGMLDRVDGLLFVAPVVYWYVMLSGV